MKKSLLTLLGVGLMLTSCQSDEPFAPTEGGEKQVTFTLTAPDAVGTRANGAAGSDKGGIANNSGDTIYYSLELYYKGVKQGETMKTTATGKQATFSPTVILGRNYEVVAYANLKGVQNDLKRITVATGINDEKNDAYFATVPVQFTENELSKEITLKRPFGKLRLVATDYDANKTAITNIEVTYAEPHQNIFDAQAAAGTGVYGVFSSNNTTVTYTATHNPDYYADTTGKTIFVDYIAAPAENETSVKFNITVDYATGGESFTRTFTQDIPVRRNALTTLKGNFFTAGAEITVTVDDAFEGGPISFVSNGTELQEAINNATPGETLEIVLGNDIELTQTLVFRAPSVNPAPAVRSAEATTAKSFILDLNGKTISAGYEVGNTTKHVYAIENYADLTIKNGFINARGNFNYGKLTIEEGVTINAIDDNGGYGVRNYPGAEFVMNGGEIATTNDGNDAPGAGYDATTLRVDEGATATIKGGKINNVCNYTYAVDNNGTTTIEGGEISSVHTTISNYGTMTINGGSFTCNGLEGITAHALVAWNGSTTTINGGTFDGKDNYNGFNVDADNGAIAYIKGGTFLSCHSGSLYGDGNIEVSGGTFFDEIAKERLAEGCSVNKENGMYTVAGPVAEVGDKKYATIDDAIANWTNNTTLTLLSDVTLNDVVTLKSTEHHILNLDTYTMTAASGKNAIEIVNNGRTSASWTLDIKADATNPGGITATGNSIVRTTGSSQKDRPMVRFYNGIFNGSYIVYHTLNKGANSPYFYFYDGVYNGTIYINRATVHFYGGTFHNSLQISVDSSAYTLISGGRFKSMNNMMGSDLTTGNKFTIGSAKGVFDRGVYVDDEGYFVVCENVITDFGDAFAAKATNVSKAGSYLPYSSAAANGLYYTNAEMAIKKHGEANVVLK